MRVQSCELSMRILFYSFDHNVNCNTPEFIMKTIELSFLLCVYVKSCNSCYFWIGFQFMNFLLSRDLFRIDFILHKTPMLRIIAFIISLIKFLVFYMFFIAFIFPLLNNFDIGLFWIYELFVAFVLFCIVFVLVVSPQHIYFYDPILSSHMFHNLITYLLFIFGSNEHVNY